MNARDNVRKLAARLLATTMLSIAAAVAVALPVALLSATIAAPAFADHDGNACSAGQSIPKGVTSGCVNDADLEFWDWCYASIRRNNSGNVCHQRTHSDCSVFHFTGTQFHDGTSNVYYCTNNGKTLCPAHQAYDPDTHACADSAPTAAPVITRPVAADWKKESFTVYWRPGAGGEAQNLTGFRIIRDRGVATATSHPTACDTADYPSENAGIPVIVPVTHDDVYEYTFDAGANGETHGNCYRWKIAAINALGTGPEAITHPILARGYVHDNEVFAYDDTEDQAGTACPLGFRAYSYRTAGWGVVCIARADIGQAEECHSLRPRADTNDTSYDAANNQCRISTTSPNSATTYCEDLGYTNNGFGTAAPGGHASREHCAIPDRCGALSEYNLDHRECHCQGWAQPASGESAASPNACECMVEGAVPSTCGCPADKPYVPAENSCGCPAGEEVDAATSYCAHTPNTALLLAEIRKANPDLASVVALLNAGTDPAAANGLAEGIRFILTAAALGHGGVVSILITAGVDPDTRHPTWFNANIPHLMAADDSPVNNLTGAQRLNVLRHFGGAIADEGISFDWNAYTSTGASGHVASLLNTYAGVLKKDQDDALAMADYMLARGMNCNHLSGRAIYTDYCIGSAGQDLVELVNKDDGNRETGDVHRLFSAQEIRNAAQAVVDAGIPIDIVGSDTRYGRKNIIVGNQVVGFAEDASSEGGHLIPLAAFNGQYHALYVLLTFGMNPKGEANGGQHRRRSALGYITRFAGTAGDGSGALDRIVGGIRRGSDVHYDPPKALNVLRAYIDGLRDARDENGNSKLSAFNGWNEQTTGYPDNNNTPERTALENFQTYAIASSYPNPFFGEEKLEIHTLLYENGARCDSSRATGRYCEFPVRAEVGRAEIPWTTGVGVLTVTATTAFRTNARFRATVVSPAVSQTLAADGWALAVAGDELVVSRTRLPSGSSFPAAVFTVTLVNAAGTAVQAAPVSAALADNNNVALLASAVLAGDAVETGRLASVVGEAGILNAADEFGTPLLLTAAALGYADIVSILITAGANPDARLASFHDVNVVHLMATYDGTEQPDGGELSRAARATVLYHFGDALAVRGTLFDWNAVDGNGNHAVALLKISDGRASAGDKVILREMGDYMRAQGMHCGHAHGADAGIRYSAFCIGTQGVALADLIRGSSAPSVSEILSAAAAMEGTGVSLTLAGSEAEGALVAIAAARRRGEALSVLLTLGFDAEGRNAGGRTAAHVIARDGGNNAPEVVDVLRYFIGGLDAAGELSGFTGWQTSGPGSDGYPLEVFNARATENNLDLEAKAEMHALFYEAGATCQAPLGDRDYCMIPATDHHPVASDTSPGGAVYTITARAIAKFRTPLVGSAVSATLAALGWTLALDGDAVVISRTRAATTGESPTISFTLTMTTGGVPAHLARVEAEVAPAAYLGLLDAVADGSAERTESWLNQLGAEYVDASDASGIPLVVAAAALGHAEVVSVLVAFGFDPDARHASWDGGAVPHMMAEYVGPETRTGDPALSWAARLGVLRHFGDAVSVRATLYDWNATDDNDNRMLDLLLSAAKRDGGANADAMGAMADYALADGRGGRCASAEVNGATADARTRAADARAHFACAGGLGAALAAVVEGLSPPVEESENESVRAAARAMVDAGLPLSLAYSSNGHLVSRAAFRRHGGAVSILITLGMDPQGRNRDDSTGLGRTALHHVGRGANNNAAEVLDVLRHFIGALSVAGKLEGFDGWNVVAPNIAANGTPLKALDAWVKTYPDDSFAPEREIQSLMYERGARCVDDASNGSYCDVPFEAYVALSASSPGAVLTVTARALAGAAFSEPLLGSAASVALDANGWTAELNASATPDEVVVSRTAQGAEELTVAITISLDVSQTLIREYRLLPAEPVGQVTVEYATVPASGSGVLSADVENGGRIVVGGTVHFTATPAGPGTEGKLFYVGEWSGDGDACPVGSSATTGAAGEVECDVIASDDVSVTVEFHRHCSGERRSSVVGDETTCGDCRNNSLQDIGGICSPRPRLFHSSEPAGAGILTVAAVLLPVESDNYVAIGATVTFTATPEDDYFVAEWRGAACPSGDVDAGAVTCPVTITTAVDLNVVAVFRAKSRDCSAENRDEDKEIGVDGDHLCGGCSSGFGDLRGLCLPTSGEYDEVDFSQRDVCELLRGEVFDIIDESSTPPAMVGIGCRNADADGTFCILHSTEFPNAGNVFPCRGLFRRVLHCNLAYERPALNPFICGAKCGVGQIAQGGACRNN